MRMSVGQKALRVVMFLLGVRNREVARMMRKYGFTDADLAKGWELLRELTRGKLDVSPAQDPRPVRELDGWENQWFPIAKLVLEHNFPEAHAHVFRNLAQASGPEVVVTVATLVERIESLGRSTSDGGLGEVGKAARKLLAQRGLTNAELAKARQLLEQIGQPELDDEPLDPEEESEEAERAMWAWYLEWSGIARIAIKQRKLLRAMGFLQGGSEPEEPVAPTPEPTPAS